MYFFGWSVVVVPELVSLAVVCGPAPCIVRVVPELVSWAIVHGPGPCIFGVLRSSSPCQ